MDSQDTDLAKHLPGSQLGTEVSWTSAQERFLPQESQYCQVGPSCTFQGASTHPALIFRLQVTILYSFSYKVIYFINYFHFLTVPS